MVYHHKKDHQQVSSSFLRKLISDQDEEEELVIDEFFVHGVTNMESALKGAMARIGGKGIGFEEISMGTDDFRDISQIVPRDKETTPPPSDEEDHLYWSVSSFLSSFIAGGYIPAHKISDSSEINTKISWTQAVCACRNANCTETIAIDPIGFFDTANGFLRGRAPLVFVGDDGDVMPCLKQPVLPSIDHKSLTLSGSCSWTKNSVEICDQIRKGENSTFGIVVQGGLRKGENSTFRVIVPGGLHDRRCVECSPESSIDGLRIFHDGKLVARAFNSSEILSSEITNPNFTLYDLLDGIAFPDLIVRDPIFDRQLFNFTQTARDLIYGSVTSTVNGLFWSASPRDFDSTKGMGASNASIAEIARVVDTLYQTQLSTYSGLGRDKDIIPTKMESLPIYVTKQIEHPEESPPQEIVNGITLLLLASCGFGAILGSFIKNSKGRYLRSIRGLSVVFGSLLVLLLESSAFYLGWMAEVEHTEFNEAFVHMEVKGSQRFTVNPLGNLDMKGAPFLVQAHVVEVSDAGETWGWLYFTGMMFAIGGLLLSAIFGPIFEGGEKKRRERNKKKNEDVYEGDKYEAEVEEEDYFIDQEHSDKNSSSAEKETDSKYSVEGEDELYNDNRGSLTNRKSITIKS